MSQNTKTEVLARILGIQLKHLMPWIGTNPDNYFSWKRREEGLVTSYGNCYYDRAINADYPPWLILHFNSISCFFCSKILLEDALKEPENFHDILKAHLDFHKEKDFGNLLSQVMIKFNLRDPKEILEFGKR